MTDLTLTEALAEVKRWNERGRYWPGAPHEHDVTNVILNAAASGDLIPRADADMAVALAVEQAAGIYAKHEAIGLDRWAETPDQWRWHIYRDIGALATADALAKVQALQAERDRLREALVRIDEWSSAYPTHAFPEPDMARAAAALSAVGMSLDVVSASNMRHATKGVGEIARAALAAAKADAQ